MDQVSLSACRLCGSSALLPVLDLGEQALTGIFPTSPQDHVPVGPLRLLWCEQCTLTQLESSPDPGDMYGDNYGYRSGLNASMVDHLGKLAHAVARRADLRVGDVVLDIGSNDGTLLKEFARFDATRVGIDPTAAKFRRYYAEDDIVVEDFFSAAAFHAVSPSPAKVITSISMFYDLEDPVGFASEVRSCLDRDGVWQLEQSYMPSMLRTTSYDTVCHEHIEYYSMRSINEIFSRAGLRMLDIRFNRVNGGSFSVTAVRDDSSRDSEEGLLGWFAAQEVRMGFDTPDPLYAFADRVRNHREDLVGLIRALRESGKRIAGLGASTKGNVLLQYCGLTSEDLIAIGDVNPDKFGAFTPGTSIPIISEVDARALQPDYFLVLPWHFREGIVARESEYLAGGGGLIFPLPEIEIVSG